MVTSLSAKKLERDIYSAVTCTSVDLQIRTHSLERRLIEIEDATNGIRYHVDAEQLLRVASAAWEIVRPIEVRR